jgi:hypothetical protein
MHHSWQAILSNSFRVSKYAFHADPALLAAFETIAISHNVTATATSVNK